MARSTRAEWAKRVERWQDSGLTAKEFAAELDISPTSLTFVSVLPPASLTSARRRPTSSSKGNGADGRDRSTTVD
jgi:hypothetical protein